MQKCSPMPNARCGFGWRSMRNANGSSNTSSSRFADAKKIASCSPSGIFTPRTSASSVAIRVKWMIGLTQRSISSTASGSSSGLVAQLLPLAPVLGEREQTAADRVARGLVARLDDQLAVHEELRPR